MKVKIRQQQHPNAIIRIKMNGIIQDNDVVNLAMIFIVAYISLVMAGTVFCAACGVDMLTSVTLIASCMGNVGPGFGEVGSLDNYSGLPGVVRVFSTLFMLLGRLEIFGLIQLFFIKWWK